MSSRLLILQHQESCPIGLFGPWLRDAGMEPHVIPLHQGNAVPAMLGDHAGLVVLGGRMGAGDDAQVRWLPAVRALIATTVSAGQPFLGICLGHQLAAMALGGRVQRNPAGRARGLTVVHRTDAGRSDPLLSVIRDGASAVQWNDDIVTVLPPGAVHLATSPDGTVQAARFGPRAWGVQFHPEVDAQIFASWTADAEHRAGQAVGVDPESVIASIAAAAPVLAQDWSPLARAFAALVTQPEHD